MCTDAVAVLANYSPFDLHPMLLKMPKLEINDLALASWVHIKKHVSVCDNMYYDWLQTLEGFSDILLL